MEKSKKTDFLLKSPFFRELFKNFFWHFHCGAVAFAINLMSWSATKHWRKQALLNDLSRDLNYFDDVELDFPCNKFQTFWIFNIFTCLYLILWYLWPTQSWGLNLNIWTCLRSKMFEICLILLLLFCLNNDQFWLLLMLRTS